MSFLFFFAFHLPNTRLHGWAKQPSRQWWNEWERVELRINKINYIYSSDTQRNNDSKPHWKLVWRVHSLSCMSAECPKWMHMRFHCPPNDTVVVWPSNVDHKIVTFWFYIYKKKIFFLNCCTESLNRLGWVDINMNFISSRNITAYKYPPQPHPTVPKWMSNNEHFAVEQRQ